VKILPKNLHKWWYRDGREEARERRQGEASDASEERDEGNK
jgi:hypothetical protein